MTDEPEAASQEDRQVERRTVMEHRLLRLELKQERMEQVLNNFKDEIKIQVGRIDSQFESESGTISRLRERLEEMMTAKQQAITSTILGLSSTLSVRLDDYNKQLTKANLVLFGNGEPAKGLVVRIDRHWMIIRTGLWITGGIGAILGGFLLTHILMKTFGVS